jgi:hypothetical protein
LNTAQQLALPLQPRRTPSRQQPAIERLRAVLKRQGIDWRYRTSGGSVLLRPLLGVRFGWQPMCGFYCCGDLVFERTAYFERPKATPAEIGEISAWLQAKREATYALWGRP